MRFEIIVACNKKRGIGINGGLPWKLKDDIRRFREITMKNKVVIMGRKTYDSLPEQHRPLKGRVNVVLTRRVPPREGREEPHGPIFTDFQGIFRVLAQLEADGYDCGSVIGGSEVYELFFTAFKDQVSRIHMTWVDKDVACDTFFPHFESFKLTEFYHLMYDDHEKCTYRYITYDRIEGGEHQEHAYLALLDDITRKGLNKSDRTGTGTRSVFGRQVRFDIEHEFPLITTKFVGYKSILKELLWFLRGDTDATKLAQEGVHIWDKNTSREFLDNMGLTHYKEGDVGPMYGWVWRHVGADYKGCDADYMGKGIDQLENVIKTLKTDPFSRRILMSTYNVSDAEKGCLYPCHGNIVQFNCDERDGKKYLSCHMYQRSCDIFLGFPYNIASYTALIYIIAAKTDMIPKDLIISLGDTHIYNNLMEQTLLQLSRRPFPFPKLKVAGAVAEKKWEELCIDDFELIGYHHHPAIKGEMSV